MGCIWENSSVGARGFYLATSLEIMYCLAWQITWLGLLLCSGGRNAQSIGLYRISRAVVHQRQQMWQCRKLDLGTPDRTNVGKLCVSLLGTSEGYFYS